MRHRQRIDGLGHVLVTGASRGVGEATAREFAAAGARVTVVARSAEPLKQLAGEIGAHALVADLGTRDELPDVVARAVEAHGPIDVLVNNAAIASLSTVADMAAGDVAATIDVNLWAPVELTRLVLPGMVQRRHGALLNICSIGGIAAFPTLTLYGATKSALSMFTSGLQRELRGTGVTATIVLLGEIVDTGMNDLAHASPGVSAVSRRLARVHAMPVITPADVGARLVDAARARASFVAIPRRVAPLEAMRVLPTRLTDALFVGIDRTEENR